MNENDDSVERQLRATALRPQDAEFTRRVLSALPPRLRRRADIQRSFAAASRGVLVLALLVAAQRWYSSSSGDLDTLMAILLFAAPALGAAALLWGPLIPRSKLRLLWRGTRYWR